MAEPPKKKGLTLYQDLLSAETLAEMQARDAKAQADRVKKEKDASLMFTPTNLGKKTSKPAPKPKPSFASSAHKHSSSSTATATAAPSASSPDIHAQQLSSTPQAQPAQKRGFSDWLADEDQEQEYYERPRYQQSSHKKKRKKKEIQEQWSFDEPYDPSVPVPFQKYPGSADWRALKDAWKERLWTARERHMKRHDKGSSSMCSDMGDDSFLSQKSRLTVSGKPPNEQFAPPSMFAPPADYSPEPDSRKGSRDPSSERERKSGFNDRVDRVQRPSFAPPGDLSKPESGDDAFARRLALSGQQTVQASTPSTPQTPPAPPKPVSDEVKAKQAAAQAKIAAIIRANAAKTGSTASPVNDTPPPPPPPDESMTDELPISNASASSAIPGVISAAPTFNPEYYAQKAKQEATTDQDSAAETTPDPDAPRSRAPGQAGFAERMMKRMGWEEGKGLGVHGEGIETAISVKAEKRKKKSDAAGGGFVTPANMGQIIGGKRKKAADEDNGPHGKMSKVVKFEGMLQGMDVDKEIADKGILQEIGEQMGDFGQVERIFIWRDYDGGNDDVFVKYTSEASAHKAIKALDGAEFEEGNILKPRYWDEEKFDEGGYA